MTTPRRHKNDSKTFSELTFEEQAKAMNMCALQFRKQLNAHLKRAAEEERPMQKVLRSRLDLLRSVISDHDKPKHRSFDEDELKCAAAHLAFDMYSFQFYAGVYKARMQGGPPALSHAAFQAMNYSLLLHLRVLLDFFYGRPMNDDCCLDHFKRLPSFAMSFSPQIHSSPAERKELILNLNRRLAHFSATRWEKPQPGMDSYAKHFEHIESYIAAFERALPKMIQDAFRLKTQQWEMFYGSGK